MRRWQYTYITCTASVTSVQYKSVAVFRVTMDFLKMSMTKHGSTGHHSHSGDIAAFVPGGRALEI